MEIQDKETLECCKQRLMNNYGVISGDQNVNKNVDSKDCVHEISDCNEDCLGNWTKVHNWYILSRKLFPFCSTLSEAEFKDDELTNLLEEISRQQIIGTVA